MSLLTEGWLSNLIRRSISGTNGRTFLKRGDMLLFGFILLVGVLWYFWSYLDDISKRGYEKNLVVRIQGEEIFETTTPGKWVIKNKRGEYVTTLHFDGERAWVTDSHCPDKICEMTGKVGPGGSIICVPNRMIIEFKKATRKVNGREIDTETW